MKNAYEQDKPSSRARSSDLLLFTEIEGRPEVATLEVVDAGTDPVPIGTEVADVLLALIAGRPEVTVLFALLAGRQDVAVLFALLMGRPDVPVGPP